MRDIDLSPHPEDPLHVDALLDVVPAAEVSVSCEAMEDAGEAFGWTAPPGEPVVPMRGLRPSTDYLCEAAPTCPPGEAVPFIVQVGAAPAGTPRFEVTGDPAAAPAFLLLNHQSTCDGTREERLVLVDRDGNPRWVHGFDEEGDPGLVARWEPPGTVFHGGTWRPQRLDVDHAVTWRGGFEGDDGYGFHHDARALEDGTILVLGRSDGILDGEEVEGFTVTRFDGATGEVLLSWDALDAAAAGELDRGVGADPWHANSVDLVDLGDGPRILVGLCHADALLALDPETGAVAWRLGRGGDFTLVDAAGQPVGDEGWPDCLHGIGVDGDRLVVFDNGFNEATGADRGRSRILDWRVDVAARQVVEVATWTEDGFFEWVWGDVDVLPDGRVLVTRGHWDCASPTPGARSELLVVDPATGEVPWRMALAEPTDGVYRAEPADPCAVMPHLGLCP